MVTVRILQTISHPRSLKVVYMKQGSAFLASLSQGQMLTFPKLPASYPIIASLCGYLETVSSVPVDRSASMWTEEKERERERESAMSHSQTRLYKNL